MRPEILSWLIPLPPILSFFLIVLFAHRSNRLSHTIAVGAMLISWALAMSVFILALSVERLGEHPLASSIAWLPTAGPGPHHRGVVGPPGGGAPFFCARAGRA